MNKEKIKNFIETNGYNLEKVGIKSFGFLKKDSLNFINLLLVDNIAISGGDVLFINKKNDIQLIFDGWYCEKEENETDAQYIKRSGVYAKDYISGYRNEHVFTETFLFDIVFDRKILLELFFEK